MAEPRQTDPNLVRLRAIEADIKAGRLGEAAKALDALRAASPADARVFLADALLARATQQADREIAALQRAVSLAPRWAMAQLELARALSRAARHAEAIAAAETVVELAPNEMAAREAAVAIADAAADPDTALRHLQAAHAQWPDNPIIAREVGVCLTNLHRLDEARVHWHTQVERNPDDAVMLGNLGACLNELGHKEDALLALEKAVVLAPDNATLKFHLLAARGETPPTQPPEMMAAMFDSYASRFDIHLVGGLKYRVPRRVADIITARPAGRNVSIIDLGCGTGLMGVYLGSIAGAFVGVDISSGMLKQAARHGIYTQLRQGELLEELQRTPPQTFDYAIANDVFIYVGNLTEVIPACFRVLRPGGALIFSCEAADDSEGAFVLRPSKRYAHSRASVQALCAQSGFANCAIDAVDLRWEGDVPTPGFIAVAEKP